MDNIIKCENCNGKGHVLYGGGALAACLSVVLIPCLFFDKNDPNGMTRMECPKCNGRGYINLIELK